MQLANIASLIYRHPMPTHFLRAIFHHFLNDLLKSGCRLKVNKTNRHCYSPLRELCKQRCQSGILKNFECKGKNRSHTELNVLSPSTLIMFKTLLYTVHKMQRTKHFVKIDRILIDSKNHISQNYEFKTHANFTLWMLVKIFYYQCLF